MNRRNRSSWEKRSGLADGDVSTDRTRVVVLEELKVQTTGAHELKRLPGAGVALVAGNNVAVAWPDLGNGTNALHSRLGNAVVGGLLGRRARKLVDGQAALAVEGEGGSLKLVLLGEEEDERARLALVRVGQVEIEDGADGRANGAVVASAVRLV